MLLLLVSVASFFTLVKSQYSCSSVGSMTHTSSGCPANEGFPDCSYIQANTAAICSTLLTSWEIVNGQNCNLRGASYGCIYAAGQYSTTDQFCCPLVPSGGGAAAPTASALPSVSALPSLSAAPSVSGSPSPSATPSISSAPSISGSPSPSATPSVSVSPSASAVPSVSANPSASATPTSSISLSSTPSHINTTIITITKIETSTVFTNGVAAAIGLASIFGFGTVGILFYCCATCLLRRRPDTNIHKIPELVERRSSIIDRRSSITVERRRSQVQVVVP